MGKKFELLIRKCLLKSNGHVTFGETTDTSHWLTCQPITMETESGSLYRRDGWSRGSTIADTELTTAPSASFKKVFCYLVGKEKHFVVEKQSCETR